MAKKLGFQFFPKTRARRRLRKLANEADQVGKRVCKLKDDVDRELTVANDIFTGAEFDREESAITKKLDEACECAAGAGGGGGSGGDAQKAAEKDCLEQVVKKHNITKSKDGGYTGKIRGQAKIDKDDCLKAKGFTP